MQSFQGKRVTVMGLGRFGGGIGVAKFMLREGAAVTVTDMAPEEKLRESMAEVGDGVAYHLGGHKPEDFTETDLVVANPAVKPASEWLDTARRAGVAITTEMNLFFERCRGRILGVTGSVGKTTTTAMIGHVLAGPRTFVGGNIGRSLLLDLPEIGEDAVVILELSSAQLFWLGRIRRAPNVSVVTNITSNHVDWHGTMEAYEDAKKEIVRHQTASDLAVLSWDDAVVREWAEDCGGRVAFWSTTTDVAEGAFVRGNDLVVRMGGHEEQVLDVRTMTVPGAHNLANAAAASAGCAAMGAGLDAVGKLLASFPGAEHRLEFVREVRGVRYYNDSKATTPASVLAAVRAFEQPTVLILGGRDKEMDFTGLAVELGRLGAAGRCRVVLMGELTGKLEGVLSTHAPQLPRVRGGRLAESVAAAAKLAKPGDVVVLSPAGTSYDEFVNFEERGKAFKRIVGEMK